MDANIQTNEKQTKSKLKTFHQPTKTKNNIEKKSKKKIR